MYLPGYFCGQSLRYLRSIEVNLIFYPLSSDLTPDFQKIKKAIRSDAVDIFLLVHYFGAISAQDRSRAFCDDYNALLVEDCAHVLSPKIVSHWVGDYLLFSPHKHFPLSSVGLSFRRAHRPIRDRWTSGSFPFFWILRALLRPLFQKKKAPAVYRVEFNQQRQQIPENVVSPNLVAATSCCLTNSESVADSRRRNYRMVQEILARVPGWTLFNRVSGQHCPYILGFICDDRDLAKKRFEILNSEVQIAMIWPDLPTEIMQLPEILDFCLERTERTLFFFIHQGIEIAKFLAVIERSTLQEGF